MNTYSVHIKQVSDDNLGPFAVFVVLDDGDDCPQTVAGRTRIQSREAAEDVARDYRAQFGVQS